MRPLHWAALPRYGSPWAPTQRGEPHAHHRIHARHRTGAGRVGHFIWLQRDEVIAPTLQRLRAEESQTPSLA